jgi:alpha 1,2-mannosyltransferase
MSFDSIARFFFLRAENRRVHNVFTEDFIRQNSFRASRSVVRQLKGNWRAFAASISQYPGIYYGKGIVICAGGQTYTTCAWVNISMLRYLGCTLPIELWYNQDELNEGMIRKFGLLDVVCRNCADYVKGGMNGFLMKPFAILNSSFREVLFLDADNNCVKDPACLFESFAYREHGAVFWPDIWKTASNNAIWDILDFNDSGSFEQESGQLVIDKAKCWSVLNLCLYFNTCSEVYYQMLLGDKDTFRLSWKALGQSFYMVPVPVALGGYTNNENNFHGFSLVQHDVNGEILFLHRNAIKWSKSDPGQPLWTHIKRRKIGGKHVAFKARSSEVVKHLTDMSGDVEMLPFRDMFNDYEDICLDFLKDLRSSNVYRRYVEVFDAISHKP